MVLSTYTVLTLRTHFALYTLPLRQLLPSHVTLHPRRHRNTHQFHQMSHPDLPHLTFFDYSKLHCRTWARKRTWRGEKRETNRGRKGLFQSDSSSSSSVRIEVLCARSWGERIYSVTIRDQRRTCATLPPPTWRRPFLPPGPPAWAGAATPHAA
jgi:hypothetical protein